MQQPVSADESRLVLLFVVVPLLLLLLVGLVLRFRLRRATIATFPDFSVTLNHVGVHEAFVTYQSENKKLYFEVGIDRRRRQINVLVSKDLSEEVVRGVVPNLAMGLDKLGWQYLIFRVGQVETLPEQERSAAIAELQSIGVDVEVSGEIMKIKYPAQVKANMTAARWQTLIGKAKGARTTLEVLARSDSATNRI